MEDRVIDSFTGPYRFLSNFYQSPLRVTRIDEPGVWRQYATVEHAYQALKAKRIGEHDRVWLSPSPKDARRIGRTIVMRDDWDRIKIEVMRQLVFVKFVQGQHDLLDRLLATGDARLVEGNTWGDRFWGVCNGVGENHLGHALMDVRRKLRASHGWAVR